MKIAEDWKDKFHTRDQLYLGKRKEFEKSINQDGLFKVIDQFGLFAGTQTLAKSFCIYEIMKKIQDVPGDIIEFGCWHGANLLLIAKILSLLEPHSSKHIYAFDSFEGLQTFSKLDPKIQDYKGKYKGNLKVLEEAINLYGFEDCIRLIIGDACKTIDQFEEINPSLTVSFAYFDFDLYTPTKKCITFLEEKLSVGGIIAFDEANTDVWKGESKALAEHLKTTKHRYETSQVSFARQPSVILRRIA